MAVNTTSECVLHIGTTDDATDIATYEADTYTAVGEIEDLGEFGDQINPVTFTSLNDGRVRKYKGTRDAGDISLVVGFDSGDAGQQALKDALDDDSSADYNFMVVLNDASTEAGTPTTFYFSGKVMSRRIQAGTADNIVKASVQIGINSAVLEEVAS